MDSGHLRLASHSTRGADSHLAIVREAGRSAPLALSPETARAGLEHLMFDLDLLRQRLLSDASAVRILDHVESGVRQMGALVDGLLAFTSGRKPKLGWVNVAQVVDEVCAALASQLGAQAVEVTTDVPRHLALLADRAMLRLAILNLVSNALEAMSRGGRLVITSFIGRDGLELEVADSGPGLSEDVLPRLFEPFFSTKVQSIGLGLAMVHHVADVHGGEVSAANCPEGGAAFTLRFPHGARRAA